jgi:hypothetical protein
MNGTTTSNEIMHACLGLIEFGQCKYDPADPTVYFGIGGAIAALGFVLAVQQLLKPIYLFRLRARYLDVKGLYGLVIAGVLAVVLAAILPNFPMLHDSPLSDPIVWEVIAAILFTVAYAAVILAIVQPMQVRPNKVGRFVRSSAQLLSAATDRDRLDFALDLDRSLPVLVVAAGFGNYRERESAFFDFTYRARLEHASYARSFLLIIADPEFCRTLVTGAPWLVARMLKGIVEDKLSSLCLEQFVRELARQAILCEESIMTREVGYYGFGKAPMLSESLFSQYFIIQNFDPLNSFGFYTRDTLTPGILNRFNSAAKRALTAIIETNSIWESRTAHSIEQFYHTASMHAGLAKEKHTLDQFPLFELHEGVSLAIEMSNNLLSSTKPDHVKTLYINNINEHKYDVLESLVKIVFDFFAHIANDFKGLDSDFWVTVIDAFMKVYPPHGAEPDGMTPFQQRLAVKLVAKLEDNMNGFYPAISRILLACVGPYQQKAMQKNRTAFMILKDAMYLELLKFPTLVENNGNEKAQQYLPDNVTYNSSNNELIHTYLGGQQAVTRLTTLNLDPISLLDAEIRQ